MSGPWLTTERLELWCPRPDDLDRVFDIHADPATYRHLPEGRMRDLGQAAQRLGHWLEHWEAYGFGYACVRTLGEERVIGFAGLAHHRVLGVPVLNVYYRFDPAAWGRGYAVEAVRAMIDRLQPEVPVLARVARNNPASIRVAEQLGLVLRPEQDPGDPVPHHLFSSAPLVHP